MVRSVSILSAQFAANHNNSFVVANLKLDFFSTSAFAEISDVPFPLMYTRNAFVQLSCFSSLNFFPSRFALESKLASLWLASIRSIVRCCGMSIETIRRTGLRLLFSWYALCAVEVDANVIANSVATIITLFIFKERLFYTFVCNNSTFILKSQAYAMVQYLCITP